MNVQSQSSTVCSRLERLVFRFKLDKTKAEAHKEDLELLLKGEMFPMSEGDTLNFNYDLLISYWGKVVDHLKAIQRIFDDPEVIVQVEADELNHGECLIQDVFEQLKSVQDLIAKRT